LGGERSARALPSALLYLRDHRRKAIATARANGDIYIFTQARTATGTEKTEAFPTISAIWASGRWVCSGLLGKQFSDTIRTHADVFCSFSE
jgi:hypothetical protein